MTSIVALDGVTPFLRLNSCKRMRHCPTIGGISVQFNGGKLEEAEDFKYVFFSFLLCVRIEIDLSSDRIVE